MSGIGSEGGTSERISWTEGRHFREPLTPVVMENRALRGAGGAGGGGGVHRADSEGLVGHIDEFDHSLGYEGKPWPISIISVIRCVLSKQLGGPVRVAGLRTFSRRKFLLQRVAGERIIS